MGSSPVGVGGCGVARGGDGRGGGGVDARATRWRRRREGAARGEEVREERAGEGSDAVTGRGEGEEAGGVVRGWGGVVGARRSVGAESDW